MEEVKRQLIPCTVLEYLAEKFGIPKIEKEQQNDKAHEAKEREDLK